MGAAWLGDESLGHSGNGVRDPPGLPPEPLDPLSELLLVRQAPESDPERQLWSPTTHFFLFISLHQAQLMVSTHVGSPRKSISSRGKQVVINKASVTLPDPEHEFK